jgi:glycosyltransferase involved in cell wall biosynthesis
MSAATTTATTRRIPALVRDLELSESLPTLRPVGPYGERAERVWLLVRMYTEPIGSLLLDLPEQGLSPAELAAAVDRAMGPAVRQRTAAAASAGPVPPYLARRTEVLRSAPSLTVVVCTREHPEQLARCLDSLIAQRYPRFRVVVVDNAPTSTDTYEVVRRAAERGPVDYLAEPQPGLSRARNRAVAACPGETLAWIDDDEVADPYWLSEIARALADHPEADVVSGVIVPAELNADAQLWFEEFGGHSKGRGFTPAVFSPATAHLQSPLYPLPPFGTGANMTFRPGVIERIGGFDEALGAGTPAMGSEDTLAFTQVLLRGGTIVYRPTALVRHYHRPDLASLRRQLVGYGRGLIAAYTSLVMADPRVLWPLLRLAPTALRDLLGAGSLRVAGLSAGFPRELLRDNRRGMLQGPLAYLRGRRQARRDRGRS